MFSSASVIETLVKAGAKVEAQDDYQNTPLHYAARFRAGEVVIRQLIKCGADVNACGKFQSTPLHYASCFTFYADVVEVLIRSGADVNACDDNLKTPLHRAALLNRKVVLVLVEHGAKVNILDSNNRTPLSYAVCYSHGRDAFQDRDLAVKALLAAGADPHLGDNPPLDNELVSDEMKTMIREHLSL